MESTCWEGTPPPGQESEIIEIGVCMLDVQSGKRLSRNAVLVKPERSMVSAFCTQLTTLTQEQVEEGLSFQEACSTLQREYTSKEHTWASWGDYDRRQFQRQCEMSRVAYPFGATHINVKNLFALIYGLPHEVGVQTAFEILGLQPEGIHHRGVDDAWNIALILSTLIMRGRIK